MCPVSRVHTATFWYTKQEWCVFFIIPLFVPSLGSSAGLELEIGSRSSLTTASHFPPHWSSSQRTSLTAGLQSSSHYYAKKSLSCYHCLLLILFLLSFLYLSLPPSRSCPSVTRPLSCPFSALFHPDANINPKLLIWKWGFAFTKAKISCLSC